jgi:hypothetical protein
VSTPWLIIKGDYGTATLTECGESVIAVLESPGHASTCERYANDWSSSSGFIAQMVSAAAHGPDAEPCTEGDGILCPHVIVECEQIVAYDLGLTEDPGCWIQKIDL